MTPRLLIIDDDTSHLASLIKIFSKMPLDVTGVPRGREALEQIEAHEYTLVLSDLMLPDIDGVELLSQIKERSPHIEVVIMTAYGTIERAVEAMRGGAYDFITKPFRRVEIERVIERALERVNLIQENRSLKRQLAEANSAALIRGASQDVVGGTPSFQQVLEVAIQAAPSRATILLQGESGTGKEVFARLIHSISTRADEPFIAVNCGALPEGVIEAELFGVEKGAYTGASSSREGRFGRAHKGTLFLDEIAELPLQLQVKLLRVLQSGEYEPVGGSNTLHSDCRVIAATNVDLTQAVREGDFREDLYYRLKVITLTLPPLRDRVGDIPLLAEHFLQRCLVKHQRQLKGISPTAHDSLSSYLWPGNVRELENVIERAVVLCQSDYIELRDLPSELKEPHTSRDSTTHRALEQSHERMSLSFPFGMTLQEVEKRLIQQTLEYTGGDKRRTAQLLGIATRTVYRKLASLEEEID